MDFTPINVVTNMIDSILEQYKESPNLLKYITVLLAPLQELEVVYSDILNLRMLDEAENAQIDTNGELVVLPRGVYDTTVVKFFGLDADDINNPVTHKGLGDLNDVTIGGVFRSIEQPLGDRTYITDSDYRATIKAKAQKNSFKGGVENLINVITEVIVFDEGESVEVKEDFTTPSDPFVLIKFHKILTLKQASFLVFLNILPKPGGIRYEYEDLNGPF